VAQRTGAISFLAPAAKTASARYALALAVAVFLLAGCGGSSDPEGGSGGEGSATGTAAAVASAPSEDTSSSAATEAKAKDKAKSESSSPSSAGQGSPQGEGAKHGPRIAAPKGPTEQAPSPAQVASATVADISLQSPAIAPSGEGPGQLPATYTCDGKNSWPELRWQGVPAGSAELILYAMSVQPVEGQLFVDWAVAGLDPGLERIEAGKLPKGAIVGTNGFGKKGYEICPPGAEIYMFAVYALPQALSPQAGFDARELRHRILDVSGNVGLLPAIYARS
jgi:phosphatidylethanolamine-binding protein (PEBP) family uncharacterized protein